MNAHAQTEQLEGSVKHRISFEEIDQRYRLKMRACINLCLSPIFADLRRRFGVASLRDRGIVPIVFHIRFDTANIPLVLLSVARVSHQIRLCRSRVSRQDGSSAERLLLDMRFQVHARPGCGNPMRSGRNTRSPPEMQMAALRALNILSRPVAAPAERQVTQVPPELARMKVHSFDEPFPALHDLTCVPKEFAAAPEGPFPILDTVWGLPNTDTNQHVNVHEYIFGMENHFSRRLHGADLPLATHRIARAQLLFRKPFFPGDVMRIAGPLYVKSPQTLLIGGFHRVDPAGEIDSQPSVAVRMEGTYDSPEHQVET